MHAQPRRSDISYRVKRERSLSRATRSSLRNLQNGKYPPLEQTLVNILAIHTCIITLDLQSRFWCLCLNDKVIVTMWAVLIAIKWD